MDKLNKRQIIWIALTIVLIFINIFFIVIAIPIWLIIFLECVFKKQNIGKDEISEEIPIENNGLEVEQLRALKEKVEIEKEKWIEYRRNVDLRQFKGRNDVTRQEVADYLWFHKIYEGRKEKCIILEEIMKVSNINEDDCKWILNEHYNHVGGDGTVGAGHWIKNEETKRILEYERKKEEESEKEYQKIFEINEMFRNNPVMYKKMEERRIAQEKRRKASKYWYVYHYEDWLKEKGYV